MEEKDILEIKRTMRLALKEKRAAIPAEKKKTMDRAIAERIAASAVFRNASLLLLYAPMPDEVNLLPLVRLARKQGKKVAFPRCDVETTTMRFYILEPDARLSKGAYQIPEPPSDAPLCEPDEHTLCILPALTFDLSGARLGYGKGYYDRFLESFSGVTAGAVYESLLVKRVPTEPHDKPVSVIFTDRSVYRPKPTGIKQNNHTDVKPNTAEGIGARINSVWMTVRKRFSEHDGNAITVGSGAESTKQRHSAPHAPPILVCATFLLLLLSRLFDSYLIDRNNEYMVLILLQVLIFVIPAVIYGKLRNETFVSRIRMRAPRPEHAWFTVCILIVMISGGMLCGILTGGISSLGGNFTLYDTFVARMSGGWETVYVILSYGILPAFCEELVYRSILCAEYERFGTGVAIAASALFFSMLHFSFPLFLTYLLLGTLLACAMYATRSFFTAFLLHLCYNIFCLFGQPYLSAFYVNAGSNEIFIFCLVVLFLLFGAFATGEARKLYHKYARAGLSSDYTVSVPWKQLPKKFFFALLSPATAVCIVIWLVMAIIGVL